MHDVVVVGAGISGLMTALRVSEKGYKTLVLERAREISAPCHGAEAMGYEGFGASDIAKNSIVRRLSKLENISPSGTVVYIEKEHITVERPKLDNCLYDGAISRGANVKFSETFKGIKESRVLTDKGEYEASIIVGADGAVSAVRKFLGIKRPDKIIKCFQYHLVPPRDYDLETHREIYSNAFCKGLSVWMTPTKETLWLGLGTLEDNPKENMHEFKPTRELIGKSKVLSQKFGFIPYGYSESFVKGNVVLVGDAAGCPNPISGGGLRRAAHSAEMASRHIIRALETGSTCLGYQTEWEKTYREDFDRKIELKNRFMELSDSQIDDGFEQIIRDGIKVDSTEEIMRTILQLK